MKKPARKNEPPEQQLPANRPAVSVTLGVSLDQAEHSLGILRGGIAVLDALARAGECAVESDTDAPLDIDWAGIRYLTEALVYELGSGTFDSLEHAITAANQETRKDGAR